jgi:hypothetical protein
LSEQQSVLSGEIKPSVEPSVKPRQLAKSDGYDWRKEPTIKIIKQFRGPPIRISDWYESNGLTVRVIGMRESGKSNLLELLCLEALRRGSCVLDLAAARDSEALAPLLSPIADKVRLIISDAAVMTSPKVELHTIPASQFRIPEDGYFYILVRSAFPNEASYFAAMKKIVETLFSSDEWTKSRWLLLREAQSFLSSIARISSSRNAREASEKLTEVNAEARHHGVSLALDSQRDMEVSRSIRQISDVLFIKRLGSWTDFPRDLEFLLADVEPSAFRYQPKNTAFVFTSAGQLAFCKVGLLPWHHRRGESILNILDIKITFDEAKVRAEQEANEAPDSRSIVLPSTHKEIIRLRDEEHMTFDDIADKLDLSASTCKLHYRKHTRRQPCPICQ